MRLQLDLYIYIKVPKINRLMQLVCFVSDLLIRITSISWKVLSWSLPSVQCVASQPARDAPGVRMNGIVAGV